MSQEEIQIPKGWVQKNLSDLIQEFEKRNPTINPDKEFKYVEIGSVSQDKKITNFKNILGKNAPSRARNVIRENDVVYGTTRPYYRNVVLISSDFDNEICSTGFCVLRVNSIEPKYLFYYMLSDLANNQIIKPMRGGNYPAVSNKDVVSIKIILPKKEIQKQIVLKLDHILGELEGKKKQIFALIEQNNERIIFFEKNWISYIIEQEIKNHPQRKEWKETTVGSEIELAYGKNLPKPERIKGDFPVYGSNGIVGSHHKFLINFPSIIIGRKGTVGAIHKTTAKFWPTDVSFYVKIKNTDNMELDFLNYLLFYLNLPRYSQSGPKSGLNRHDIYKIEFLLPSISDQKQITRNIKNAEEKFKEQKTQFEKIKQNYESRIKYIDHIQSSILGSAFSGKLVN